MKQASENEYYLNTLIATSGHISAHNAQPVQLFAETSKMARV
jgi:hypothetical protein